MAEDLPSLTAVCVLNQFVVGVLHGRHEKIFSRLKFDFTTNDEDDPLKAELLKCNKTLYVDSEVTLNKMYHDIQRNNFSSILYYGSDSAMSHSVSWHMGCDRSNII